MKQTAFPADTRRARLARRHLLVPGERLDSVAGVVDALVCLHSSDPVTAYLSAAVRMSTPDVARIDRAFYVDRDILRHHAMRRTLWVLTPTMARVAHASSTLALVAPMRRSLGKLLVDNGITDDPERWLDDAIVMTTRALDELGGATTRELGDALPELRTSVSITPNKPYGSSISVHTRVLTLMGFMGLVVRTRPVGSWISSQYRWTIADRWLAGGFGHDDPDIAAAVLADRYLRAFGPASITDLRWWTGWTKRTTTAALERAGAETVDCGGDELIIARGDTELDVAADPWVAVLPSLDPTVMGWKERSWYLPDEYVPMLFDRNGNAGPTIWVDGRVVGGWALSPSGEFRHRVFEPLTAEHNRLLHLEIERLISFMGDTRCTARFPTQITRELMN